MRHGPRRVRHGPRRVRHGPRRVRHGVGLIIGLRSLHGLFVSALHVRFGLKHLDFGSALGVCAGV